ncbi:hypothetical protein KUTeg_013438 [Tegillarca granosa]|uniref:PiggyBac transposable element-derived protein domain-containing protein n=1 Tax=Tegillarca granosa TaxID=220873 RepID=A0ABQ9EU21_TEGGR|nr:hypothetical protein KUTeg_013438 [Tegillarca granosa]
MPLKRFQALTRFFHINDNTTQGQQNTPDYDRFFTSVPLVRTLYNHGIYSCGAIKSDREGFPQELRSPKLVRGETEQRQHGNLVATVWNDSNYYDLLDFRLDIANQLINNFSCRKRKIPTENPVGGPLHEQVRSDRPKSTCKWCPKFGEKKRKETVKGCSLCNVHLCSINCFDRYHQN